ncbi:HAD family hydrolase [Blautia sp. MSJ-19]|uniref:HAD family hydrolase n=1 Tax=Blautia sp. MSJ-19 TaxID=2841517 RepID=UPI001C0F13A3|nr:HAD-IA family hydrolase [Blautia sp. MSJ-19]MBU5480460.1 HAD-IA family hydrolase [Blautia sp. MSJ-19]
MIKAVIFDIDNTLYSYDENHMYGMQALADYCNRTFDISEEEMRNCYKKAGIIMIDRIGTDTAAIHSRMLRMLCMLELLGQPLFPHVRNMYHAYWDTLIAHAVPSPGVLEFLKELKDRNIRIGIGTDMTAYIQYKKLEAIGAAPYIDFIVTSEEAGIEKPAGRFFELCVEKAGVAAEECAFIGDNVRKDIEGAWENGLKGIWYTQEKEPAESCDFPTLRSFVGIDVEEFLNGNTL